MTNWLNRIVHRRAEEIHEEIECHLAMRAEMHAEEGMPPREARFRARAHRGGRPPHSRAAVARDRRALCGVS
jgi:hypothetical protein